MSRRLWAFLCAVILVEVVVGVLLVDTASTVTAVVVFGLPSLIGGVLLVYEGIHCYRQAVKDLAGGNLCEGPSADDLGMIFAGVLLLLPGLLTDVLALAILATPLRRYLGRWFKRQLSSDFAAKPAQWGGCKTASHR